MKTTQRVRYAECIEQVVRYLQDSDLEQTLSVPALAQVASMSEFHFHRIFRLMTGEPIGETVRRIRLARSLAPLSAGVAVTTAATDSGYSTPQSYARAMRAQTGQSPTNAQAAPALLAEQLRHARRAPAGSATSAIVVEIVSVSPFRLLAVRNTGAYAELNSTYARLFELVLAEMTPADVAGIYCIQLDDPRYTSAAQCRAVCALDVGAKASANQQLEQLELGGHHYAKLRHFGNYDLIDTSIDQLYEHVLLTLALEPAASPLYIHYLDDPEHIAEAELRSDLYLPLKFDQGGRP
jgi:AraC family transcriptional regulator